MFAPVRKLLYERVVTATAIPKHPSSVVKIEICKVVEAEEAASDTLTSAVSVVGHWFLFCHLPHLVPRVGLVPAATGQSHWECAGPALRSLLQGR